MSIEKDTYIQTLTDTLKGLVQRFPGIIKYKDVSYILKEIKKIKGDSGLEINSGKFTLASDEENRIKIELESKLKEFIYTPSVLLKNNESTKFTEKEIFKEYYDFIKSVIDNIEFRKTKIETISFDKIKEIFTDPQIDYGSIPIGFLGYLQVARYHDKIHFPYNIMSYFWNEDIGVSTIKDVFSQKENLIKKFGKREADKFFERLEKRGIDSSNTNNELRKKSLAELIDNIKDDISDLNLDRQTEIALRKLKDYHTGKRIITIKDIILFKKEEVLRVLGENGLDRVYDKFEEKGINISYFRNEEETKDMKKVLSNPRTDYSLVKLELLGLDTRAFNWFKNKHCETLEDVFSKFAENEVRTGNDGMGEKTLTRILSRFKELGIDCLGIANEEEKSKSELEEARGKRDTLLKHVQGLEEQLKGANELIDSYDKLLGDEEKSNSEHDFKDE